MDIYVFDESIDSFQLAFRCDFLEQCINLLAYLHSRHLPFSISLLSIFQILILYVAPSNLYYIRTFVRFQYFSRTNCSLYYYYGSEGQKLAKVGNRLQLWTLICMDYHIDPASAPVVPWRSFPTYRVSECCRCTAFQLSISVFRSELIPDGERGFSEK